MKKRRGIPTEENFAILVPIPEALMPYLAEAIVRFQYLNPDILIDVDGNAVSIVGASRSSEAKRELLFALYRQKIYEESLPMRRALIAGVTGA